MEGKEVRKRISACMTTRRISQAAFMSSWWKSFEQSFEVIKEECSCLLLNTSSALG